MFPAFGGDRWWPLTAGVAVFDSPLRKVLKAAKSYAAFQVERWESTPDLDTLLADHAPFLSNWTGEPVLIGARDGRTVMLDASNTTMLPGLENFAAAKARCAYRCALFAPRGDGTKAAYFISQDAPRRGHDFRALEQQWWLSAVRNEDGWHFAAYGPVRPYEDLAAYDENPKSTRLTLARLGDYLRGEGIAIDDPDYLEGPVWFGRRRVPPWGARWWNTLGELREQHGCPVSCDLT